MIQFEFREGTMDREIFDCVVQANEYKLPPSFSPDDIILDIGVHIGSFCHAVLERGAGHVYGYEASPENYALAQRNLAIYGSRVSIRHAAAWRSDQPVSTLELARSPTNLGGHNVWSQLEGEQRESVPAIPFDQIIDEITHNGQQRIRLLKMDCEGSEFPILLTSKRLHLIDSICGEFHEFGGPFHPAPDLTLPAPIVIPGIKPPYTIDTLLAPLTEAGLSTQQWERSSGDMTHLGLFFANRSYPQPIEDPYFKAQMAQLHDLWAGQSVRPRTWRQAARAALAALLVGPELAHQREINATLLRVIDSITAQIEHHSKQQK